MSKQFWTVFIWAFFLISAIAFVAIFIIPPATHAIDAHIYGRHADAIIKNTTECSTYYDSYIDGLAHRGGNPGVVIATAERANCIKQQK